MAFSERRKNKRISLPLEEGIELEFVLNDDAIRCPILDISEHGLSISYPDTAPDLAAGYWLGNVIVHRDTAAPLQLRVLAVVDSRIENERRILRLLATDDHARAGLWLLMDWLSVRRLGLPSTDSEAAAPRVRPIPLRGIYTEKARLERLDYIRSRTGLSLNALQHTFLRAESLSGNIENLVGSVEVPVGLAGPLLFKGERAQGLVFAPMATTEGALVASATRGAIAVTRSGGVATRVVRRQMTRVPLFIFSDMNGAYRFCNWVRDHFEGIREQTVRVSSHANLLAVQPELRGNMVTVAFLYETGDAAGQNMSTSCTWHACQWLMKQISYLDEICLENFFIESGISGDKKVSFQSLISGRGTRVTAECLLQRSIVEDILKVTPEELVRGYELAAASGVQSGTVGWNINIANMIAALFTATGQDIACIHESSVAMLYMRKTAGGVYASVVLPSLVIGTVGGGTHLPRQTEFLQMLGCDGPGKVSRLAEIIAGFCLALDLSTLAAIAGGQFAAAHERLGRNRPVRWFVREDFSAEFFRPAMCAAFSDPAAVVETVQVQDAKDTDSSILTELTARKIEKLIGLFPVHLRMRDSNGTGFRELDVMVKVKPLDDEVIFMTHHLAAMCGAGLAGSHARFKDRIGFKGCHIRELAVYEQTDPRFRRHVPTVYSTFRDDEREAYVIVMEKLEGLELMESANDPASWREEHLAAAIRGIAAIHSIWYGREEELRGQRWLGPTLTATDMMEMRELWEDLNVHASREFPDWYEEFDLVLSQKIIDGIPEWWPRMESMPRTLIHNDFNPRNLAFRRDASEVRLCAYDWELATIGLPQHDLAELLCYILTADTPAAEVDRWLEFHRNMLSQEAGIEIPIDSWREGFKLSLFDLALNRIALNIAAHTFRNFPFMERVHATLRHLITLFNSEMSGDRAASQLENSLRARM
jgi:hydroxymethylglutaryl-CoA reductase (NADPH)